MRYYHISFIQYNFQNGLNRRIIKDFTTREERNRFYHRIKKHKTKSAIRMWEKDY